MRRPASESVRGETVSEENTGCTGATGAGDGVPVAVKVAVAASAALIATVQVPVPAHAPDQPANVDPAAGVAVRFTLLTFGKFCAQVPGQEIPGGLLDTTHVEGHAVRALYFASG